MTHQGHKNMKQSLTKLGCLVAEWLECIPCWHVPEALITKQDDPLCMSFPQVP